MYVNPAGNRSLTTTLVASLGPAFATVIVKVTFAPRLGVALLTILVRERSARGVTVISTALVSAYVLGEAPAPFRPPVREPDVPGVHDPVALAQVPLVSPVV